MRMTAETTKKVEFAGHQRTATVERVITRADDCAHIGELFFRLSDIYRRLDMAEGVSDIERTELLKELGAVTAEIDEYRGYLGGYAE